MELGDYVRVLRRQWRLILLCILLAVGAAAALTAAATPQYRSSVTFFVSTPGEDTGAAYTGGLFSQQRVRSYADIVTGSRAVEAVLEADPALEREQVRDRITAQAVPETVLLETTVVGETPDEALAVARALAEALPGLITTLERQDGGTSPIKVSVVEEPQRADSPFSPVPSRNIALAFALGLLLGVGVAVLRETLDNTVKAPEDVRALTGAATLGAVSYDQDAVRRPLIVHDSPRSPRAEAFRQLRTSLQFIGVDTEIRSITITSSLPKEGKSTLACNLAIALAQAGVRVCLVEGDLRRPRVADYLGVEGAIGVTNVLIGTAPLDDVLQPWGDLPLWVLASGPIPPNPAELLASKHMSEVLADLENRFDYVIIDAPPLLPVTDAAVMARMTDGALLVVRAGSTRTDQLKQAAAALASVEARVLGAVLNMVPRGRAGAYGYGYGYGYGAYETDKRKTKLSDADAARAAAAVGTRSSARSEGQPADPALLPRR